VQLVVDQHLARRGVFAARAQGAEEQRRRVALLACELERRLRCASVKGVFERLLLGRAVALPVAQRDGQGDERDHAQRRPQSRSEATRAKKGTQAHDPQSGVTLASLYS